MTLCGGQPRTFRRVLEFHDSKLLAVRREGASLVLDLDAYVHESLGNPGVDAGTGWSQRLTLAIRSAAAAEPPFALPAWLSDGDLTIDGRPLNPVRVPFETAAPLTLTLHADGAAWTLVGTGLQVAEAGPPTFIERTT